MRYFENEDYVIPAKGKLYRISPISLTANIWMADHSLCSEQRYMTCNDDLTSYIGDTMMDFEVSDVSSRDDGRAEQSFAPITTIIMDIMPDSN